MMRAGLIIAAVGMVFLGLWLISAGFVDPAPPATSAPQQVIAAPPQASSPIVPGIALLAGGVVSFILILRRK